MVAQDASSNFTITEPNISTGALIGTAWTLPAAFTSSQPPGSLAIEPVNGDFIVTQNYVNSGTFAAYVIPRASGTTNSLTIKLSDIGSSTSAKNGLWQVAYDPTTNHLFIFDASASQVSKYILNLLISPQS